MRRLSVVFNKGSNTVDKPSANPPLTEGQQIKKESSEDHEDDSNNNNSNNNKRDGKEEEETSVVGVLEDLPSNSSSSGEKEIKKAKLEQGK